MKQSSKQQGFTLIEILVSFALFTTVITISVGSVLAITSANQKARSLNTAIESMNFAFESMAREIRVGNSYNCDANPASGSTNDCDSGDTGEWFGFISSDSQFTEYRFNGTENSIERRVPGQGFVRMTASNIVIDSFRFYVTGSDTLGSGDTVQPRVTLVAAGRTQEKAGREVNFSLQTTVTQRFPDI